MQDSFFYFLGAALVPVLGANVTAGAAGNVHGALVAVAAVVAFPDQLSFAVAYDVYFACVAAFLAVVALGVEFCIHDVVVDVLEQGHYGRYVAFHVGHFHVAYGSSRA